MPDLNRHSHPLGSRPALIVVDLSCGFTDVTCPLGSDCTEVLAANCAVLELFRERNLPIFFTTTVYHDPDQAKVFRKRLPAVNVLQPDSKWVKIDERLQMREGEVLVEKQWPSCFFDTTLHKQLQAEKVDSLVVTGVSTSGCVRATVLDGMCLEYPIFVPRESVGDRNPQAHENNLFDIHAKLADVGSVEDLKTMLTGSC